MDNVGAIKLMMKAAGLTQTELGNRIGKRQSNIAMYLSSGNGLRLENLLEIVDACGYDIVLRPRESGKPAFICGKEEARFAEDVPEQKREDADVLTPKVAEMIQRMVAEEVRTAMMSTPTPGSSTP